MKNKYSEWAEELTDYQTQYQRLLEQGAREGVISQEAGPEAVEDHQAAPEAAPPEAQEAAMPDAAGDPDQIDQLRRQVQSLEEHIVRLNEEARQKVADRVAVFVDVQNMYYAAKRLFSARLSYQKLLELVGRQRKLVRAVAYIVDRGSGPGQENFIDLLRNTGYETRVQHVGDRNDPFARKGEWGLGIAVDTLSIADKVDVVVLVSGDPEIEELIVALQSRGVRVEVSGFRETTAPGVIRAANAFIALEQNTLYEKSLSPGGGYERPRTGHFERPRTDGYERPRPSSQETAPEAPAREAGNYDDGYEDEVPERPSRREYAPRGERVNADYPSAPAESRPPFPARESASSAQNRGGGQRPRSGRGQGRQEEGRPPRYGNYASRQDQGAPRHSDAPRPGMPTGQPRRPHGSASYRPGFAGSQPGEHDDEDRPPRED